MLSPQILDAKICSHFQKFYECYGNNLYIYACIWAPIFQLLGPRPISSYATNCRQVVVPPPFYNVPPPTMVRYNTQTYKFIVCVDLYKYTIIYVANIARQNCSIFQFMELYNAIVEKLRIAHKTTQPYQQQNKYYSWYFQQTKKQHYQECYTSVKNQHLNNQLKWVLRNYNKQYNSQIKNFIQESLHSNVHIQF
eukprot:TRINITY_DN7957_c0_g2_i9.p2 TRINITY_DN7957_c0_g2~~TRINITY_DN7957_c0_g2_i9.p2  ORF type:complete len:194 (+),score=-15.75 TRINITY_DN7957_c0_g2_i9:596-1177(+)